MARDLDVSRPTVYTALAGKEPYVPEAGVRDCSRSVRGKEVAMGVPVQVVLDIPQDIAAGLVSGDLVRVGGVVRSAKTGAIVKHLGEGRLPAKKTANVGAKFAQRVWGSTGGKVAVFLSAVVLLAGGVMVAAGQRSSRRHTRVLNAALKAYLDAAKEGAMTVEQVDVLSSAIEAARGGGSSDSALIAEKVVNLVESYTADLARANETTWEPERGADVVPLVRIERSLSAQRRILETAG